MWTHQKQICCDQTVSQTGQSMDENLVISGNSQQSGYSWYDKNCREKKDVEQNTGIS